MLEMSLSRITPKPETINKARTAFAGVLKRPQTTFPRLVKEDLLWQDAARVGQELKKKYKKIVICGIGGSSLGAQVVAALGEHHRIYFLDNVDGASFDRLMAKLDFKSTGYLFVSKSGGTIETLAAADYIREILAGHGLDLSDFAHVMTESPTNTLGRWAAAEEIPWTLIPADVGGRYSVLSPVGMVPAVICDLSLEKFRAGAARALAREDVVIDLSARFFESFGRQEWITVFWFYDNRGKLFGAWLQQLWAESLGKKVGRSGQAPGRASTPMFAIGAVDQHSFLQQIMEGAADKFVVFVRSNSAESGHVSLKSPTFTETALLKGHPMGRLLKAEALATEEALHQSGVSTLTLQTEVLDEDGLGELFMMFQMIVATLGEMLDLDPFDQPGVELGKRLAKDYLQRT